MAFIIDYVTAKSSHHDKNEDSFICSDKYIIVADGMGGEVCGDIASKIAVSTISSILDCRLDGFHTEDAIRELSYYAISMADLEIAKYIASNPGTDGMGTTVLLLIHIDLNIYVAWCGDSRCYYYTPSKRLNSLTVDHSYVQQLIDDGKISVEESFSHPDNNIITRYVGGGKAFCVPDFESILYADGSVIVLCSDGLSGYCRIRDIEKEIDKGSYGDLSKRLLDLAIKKGSNDDITIVTLFKELDPFRSKVREWLKSISRKMRNR